MIASAVRLAKTNFNLGTGISGSTRDKSFFILSFGRVHICSNVVIKVPRGRSLPRFGPRYLCLIYLRAIIVITPGHRLIFIRCRLLPSVYLSTQSHSVIFGSFEPRLHHIVMRVIIQIFCIQRYLFCRLRFFDKDEEKKTEANP